LNGSIFSEPIVQISSFWLSSKISSFSVQISSFWLSSKISSFSVQCSSFYLNDGFNNFSYAILLAKSKILIRRGQLMPVTSKKGQELLRQEYERKGWTIEKWAMESFCSVSTIRGLLGTPLRSVSQNTLELGCKALGVNWRDVVEFCGI
jgi:hypothetical protein